LIFELALREQAEDAHARHRRDWVRVCVNPEIGGRLLRKPNQAASPGRVLIPVPGIFFDPSAILSSHIDFALISYGLFTPQVQKDIKNGGERGIRTPSSLRKFRKPYSPTILFSFSKLKNRDVIT